VPVQLKMYYSYKFIIIALIIVLIGSSSEAQDLGFEWFKLLGGDGKTEGTSICSDPDGNIYIGGFFAEEFSIDNVLLTSRGEKDMLLVKLYPDGRLNWAKSYGGTHDDYISQLRFINNSLVVAGSFSDTVQLEDTVLIADELGDLFIADFSREAELLSVHRETGYGGIHLNEFEIDDNGNYYITGRFNRELIIGDQVFNGSMYYEHNPWTGDSFPRYNENMFIVKYDPFFQAEWIKHYYQGLGSDWEEGLALEVDSDENVYFTCYNRDHPVEIEGNLINDWLFLSKLDRGGNMKWYVEAGPTRNVARPQSLLLDNLAIYVGGQVGGDGIFVGNEMVIEDSWYDGFLCRFDTSGNLQWFEKIGEGSVIHSYGPSENMINSIHVFRDTIYVGGHFMGHIIDQNSGIHLEGKYDSFVAKFSRDGRMLDAGQRVVDSWSDISDMIVNDRGIIFTGFSYEGNMSSNMPSYLIAGKVDSGSGSLMVNNKIVDCTDQLTVFPNPLAGRRLYINCSMEEIIEINFYDCRGREFEYDRASGKQDGIYLPELKPGVYYLSLITSSSKFLKRIIKL